MASELTTIVGAVAGGHRLDDLGIRIGHGEAVTIPSSQASTSKDLKRAVLANQVRVRRNATCRENRQRILRSEHASELPRQPRQSQEQRDVSNTPTRGSGETDPVSVEDAVQRTHHLLERQNGILERIEKQLERERPQAPSVDLSGLEAILQSMADRPVIAASPTPGTFSAKRSAGGGTDVPQFIPSQIKSGRIKKPDRLEAEEAENASSSLDETAALLRAMQQKDEE